ncbi:MAG: hypothetical protein EBS38_06980 [Actinobacteria bacterium]|nr:hypothetical protein [Actinomycetota bacterium]
MFGRVALIWCGSENHWRNHACDCGVTIGVLLGNLEYLSHFVLRYKARATTDWPTVNNAVAIVGIKNIETVVWPELEPVV